MVPKPLVAEPKQPTAEEIEVEKQQVEADLNAMLEQPVVEKEKEEEKQPLEEEELQAKEDQDQMDFVEPSPVGPLLRPMEELRADADAAAYCMCLSFNNAHIYGQIKQL